MFFRTRWVVIALLVCAGVAGYLWIGALLEEIPIGLDASAFPAGGAIQAAAQWIWPDLERTFAGVFWLAVSLLCIALVVFFAVRASVRHGLDPARRRFLTGVATGFAASAVALVDALGAGAARWPLRRSVESFTVKRLPRQSTQKPS